MAEENTFRIKLTTDGVKMLSVNEKHNNDRQINLLSADEGKFTLRKQCFREFDEFFDEFIFDVLNTCETEKQMNTFFALSIKLVESSQRLGLHLFDEQCNQSQLERIEPIMNKCSEYIQKKLNSYKTSKLRLREFKKKPMFVEPEEVVIGMKWKTKTASDRIIPNHTLVPTTFEFVSPLKTLKSLFASSEFRNQYFEHNEGNELCKCDVYENFCCGSNFKNNELFQRYPNSLQIELSIDDFETCSPLKSKATIHKICAIYFRIRNMPAERNSKQKSIYLVALCESSHLKSSECSINDILRLFIRDINELETIGLEICPGIFLRGTLINTSQDNLGANGLFGYVECFIVDNCCRFCVCTQDEMQTIIDEEPDKMRNKESYAHCISQIDEDDSGETIVNGIKRYCVLNDLNHYHMLENTSVDLMHDMNEGVVPFFVKFFLNFMMDNRILALPSILSKVRDFNYGTLESRNKPSLVRMNAHNVGQNASQVVCLMRHMPFIFSKQRERMVSVWSMMVDLLRIMQILFSTTITEGDVVRLEKLIEKHLRDLVSHGQKLIFKHHMLTHYPNVIRRTGPVIHGWMMRYESFHKRFTHRARTTNNFINIAKTLAYSHQQKICLANVIVNDFIPSKKNKRLIECSENEKFSHLFRNQDENEIVILDFLHFSSYEYRKGLLVINDRNVFMIDLVLHNRNLNTFSLLCDPIKICGFEESFNSLKISNDQSQSVIIDINSLNIKETFDKIFVDRQMYLFAKDLNFSNLN